MSAAAECGRAVRSTIEGKAGSVSGYGAYFLKRLAQFALVVFIGINLTFFITHLTPIDPVEQTISALTAFSATSPEAIEMMRESLQELYGLKGF